MASTIIIKNKNTGTPSSLVAGELAINTTEGSLYYGSTGGTSVSSSFKFGALTSSTFTNTGDVVIGGSVGATIYNSTTSATGYKLNGIKFLWRDGGADLQVGNTAHKTDIIGTNIDLQAPVTASMISASAGFTGSNAFFDGNITSSGTISASGMIQTAGAISSSTGITASDAFFSGHVTASNLSLAGTITHTEDTGTGIAFGENRINFAAGGQENLIVGRTGISTLIAGNALNIGAHAFTAKQLVANVTDGTTPMQITSTTLVSNLNADKLDGADLIDEDDMSSNSATAVPTQQSVKAYADTMLPLAGGTMTGAVNFGDQDITNVDSLDADKLSIAGGTEMTAVNDEDDMASNSATALATQQSIKAYVDTQDAKQHLVLASHAFAIPRTNAGGNLTGDYIQGNTTWGWADRAWVGNYGTTPDTGFDPTHIMNGILIPYDVTNIKAEVRLQSNKGDSGNTESGSFWLFKHPHTGSAVSNTAVNLIAIGMNQVKYTVSAEVAYPPFTVSSSKLVTQYTGDDNAISASAGDMIFPFYKEDTGGQTAGHARGVFIITAEKV